MKIGDYARTKDGAIAKVEQIIDNEIHFNIKPIFSDGECLGYNWFYIKDVVKASDNIIDLLEVGDIITFKEDEDVYKILQIPNEKCGLKDFYLVKNYDGITEDIFVKYDEMKEYINSIVAKEKFEIMQYKVVE